MQLFIEQFLNEKTFALVDALEEIAKAHETTVARVALAWVQARPGVTSVGISSIREKSGALARISPSGPMTLCLFSTVMRLPSICA